MNQVAKEFNKTPYGIRAMIFTTIPVIISLIFIILTVIICILNVFLQEEEHLFMELYLILGMNSFILTCIAQLNYGKMLKDYATTIENVHK